MWQYAAIKVHIARTGHRSGHTIQFASREFIIFYLAAGTSCAPGAGIWHTSRRRAARSRAPPLRCAALLHHYLALGLDSFAFQIDPSKRGDGVSRMTNMVVECVHGGYYEPMD
jgi:hypothetical protein